MDVSFLELLNSKITEYQLEEYRTQIVDNALECFIAECTEPNNYSEIGNSRFGGLPDLPDDLAWPIFKDEHLIFQGQINLRDIQSIDARLPRKGIIYLFLGDNEQSYDVQTEILYCPDESKARKGKLPEDYNPMYEDEDYFESPYRVKFTRQLSLPGYGNDLLETMGLWDEDSDELIDQYLNMVNSLRNTDTDSHQIFGHIHYLNEDPRKYASEKFDQTEWIFLLQLGWDKKVGFNFWDAGNLIFLIEKQSLLAGNFTSIFSCIETT
jgi:uncharacterized protein YwqG